jgi:hypothetical protein
MSYFGGINSGDARRAHLALVGGTDVNATSSREGAASVQSSAPSAARTQAAITAYSNRPVEQPRSRFENGIRAVAKTYSEFEDALLPMVLASGVSGESATAVRDAILGNPALRAQAERAFQRSRMDAAE